MHSMYLSSATFPTIDHWTNDLVALSSGNPPDENGSGPRTSPDSNPRSASPEWSTQTTDNYPLQTDNAFARPQTVWMPRKFAPYQGHQVSFLPETVNTAWGAQTQSMRAFDNAPCTPKRHYFEAYPCCRRPRLQIFHECCNIETRPREIIDERPPIPRRNFPPVASKLTLCRFCLKNGEPPSVYYDHNLHAEDGRVSCPVLRRYDCPVCKNGGGDYAHTVRYCPTLRAKYARG